MSEWFRADPVLAVLYILAVPATVILVLQTILLMFGIGQEDGAMDSDTSGLGDGDSAFADEVPDDPDFDGEADGEMGGDSGLRLITVRGMVAFFSVGGWAGIAARRMGAGHVASVLIALAFGIAALFIVALFFKWIMKIRHNGTMRVSNAVGSVGEVYITVPANRSGTGKVNVMLQSQLTELTAVTDADRHLRYGEQIRVIGTLGENTLIVEPLNEGKVTAAPEK